MSDYGVRYVSQRRTICEVLREIRWECRHDPEIQKKCDEAIDMAKRMNVKLTKYKADWDAGFFEDNPEFHVKHARYNTIKARNDRRADSNIQ